MLFPYEFTSDDKSFIGLGHEKKGYIYLIAFRYGMSPDVIQRLESMNYEQFQFVKLRTDPSNVKRIDTFNSSAREFVTAVGDLTAEDWEITPGSVTIQESAFATIIQSWDEYWWLSITFPPPSPFSSRTGLATISINRSTYEIVPDSIIPYKAAFKSSKALLYWTRTDKVRVIERQSDTGQYLERREFSRFESRDETPDLSIIADILGTILG